MRRIINRLYPDMERNNFYKIFFGSLKKLYVKKVTQASGPWLFDSLELGISVILTQKGEDKSLLAARSARILCPFTHLLL
jgi:hypothetical protein